MHVKLVSRNNDINIIRAAVITAWNIATTNKNHDSSNIDKHNIRYFTLRLKIEKFEIIKRREAIRNEKKRKREKEVK